MLIHIYIYIDIDRYVFLPTGSPQCHGWSSQGNGAARRLGAWPAWPISLSNIAMVNHGLWIDGLNYL